jgi:hypothetical protein
MSKAIKWAPIKAWDVSGRVVRYAGSSGRWVQLRDGEMYCSAPVARVLALRGPSYSLAALRGAMGKEDYARAG